MTLALKIQGKLKKKKKVKYENINLKIGQMRGRPLLLDVESDLKLRSMIVSLLTARAGINVDVVGGDLMGLVQSNHEKFDKYLSFHVSRFWVGLCINEERFHAEPPQHQDL